MGFKRTHDLVVAVGEYQSNGETKKRHKNIGTVLTNENGERFLLIDRTFNPAGVPCDPSADTIAVSMYEIRDRDSGGGDGGGRQQQRQQPSGGRRRDENDDIPF